MKQAPNMELKRELAARIKEIRTNSGLNQTLFAKSIEISRVHLSHIESLDYEAMPSKPLLKKLCETYNVNFDWLMTGEGEIYKKNTNEDFAYNENIVAVKPALVEQTKEYVHLKTAYLLDSKTMDKKRFSRYFHLFTSLTNLIFRLMDDVRNYYISKTDIPDDFYDPYIDEFKNILKS